MIWTMEPTAKKLEDVETKVGNVGSTDLQSQVNALNSKFDPYSNSAISDCNVLLSTGRYKAINSTVNTPFASHFAIDVIAYSQSEVSQTAKQVFSSRIFARGTADGGATWSAWEELAPNSKIETVIDTSTTLQSLKNGMNAIKVNSGTVIGSYTVTNNVRGYAIKDGTTIVGFLTTYNGDKFITVGNNSQNHWEYAVEH